ncbi:MAG TPA: polysaccharide deacetylase family protein [Longimicrobiales bacterium]|nr:polysaccharide deacetylase family protein [Longimicrobiales bacterium]
MPRRRDPVPRARDSWVWLGGILTVGILGAGVISAATLLWENVDVRQLAPALAPAPAPPPVPRLAAGAAHPDAAFAAVLFDSPRNAAFFPDTSYYATALEGWEAVALQSGANVRRVATAQELGTVLPEEVLLLPEAPCLTRDEVTAVRRHLARGGGVVANWALGVRDGDCQWLGWRVLQDLTGALDVRETEPRAALYLTIPAGLALSPGLDPGTRLELRGDPSLALRAEGTRVYWSDWAMNPLPDESGGGADVAALATRTRDGGRVAWFGPRLDQAATPDDSLRLVRLAQNGVHWAAGVPLAQAAPWPLGHRAGLVFALEVESEPRNAEPVAALLRQEGVPGTFFAVTRLVEGDEELSRILVAAGEVGSQTTDHAPLAGLTAQDQAVRLRRSWNEVEGWTGIAPRGLRPPEETFDGHTLRGWVRAGGSYLLALNNARSAGPELHDTPDGTVVLIPRLMKDDYNVFVQEGAIRAARLSEAWLEGTEKLRALGGVAVMAGHTQILGVPARLAAVREVLDTVQAQGDWWVTTGGEMAEWWQARDGVRLSWVEPDPDAPPLGQGVSPGGLHDLVAAVPQDGAPLRGVWVELILPGGTEGLIPWVDGQPSDFAAAQAGIRIPLGEMAPGVERRVQLVRVEASSEDGGL